MKKLVNQIIENLVITDAVSNGKSLGRLGELVVFVPFTVPGDIVDVKIVVQKKQYLEARLIYIHNYSEKRVQAYCEHFGVCGGCQWQHISYFDQLYYKRKTVVDNFIKIGRFQFPEVMPVMPSTNTIFYRNKIEYAFSTKRWLSKNEIYNQDQVFDKRGLGFYIPLRFDRVLDIKKCYLQKEPSNSIRLALKKFVVENDLDFYDIKQQTGFMRNVIIRNSPSGDYMVILVFKFFDETNIHRCLDFLADEFPEITSLHYVINEGSNDMISHLQSVLYKGKPYITEVMEDLEFRVSPLSFFQTNSLQAYKLYKVAREFADIGKKDIVYDLYTGTGTIALFVAKLAKKVIGIEYNEKSVLDANINAKINKIKNTEFYWGDMAKILDEKFFDDHGKPDIIITDPPRVGMHTKVVEQIIKAAPKKIVYVSCNPATQARDLLLMIPYYNITKVQPVDMFPHTHHVENVVLLERIES